EYISDFEALVPRTKYDGESLVYFFKKGLNSGLLDDCLRADPVPVTLAEWKKKAMDRNAAYIERVRTMATTKRPARTSFTPAGSTPQNCPRVAATSPPPQNLTRLTEQEREQLRQKRACFRCRQEGHIAVNCP
ncbi:hypothetical protein FA95DRAFT_1452696, partial [Auriscalpium vulgare]